jgi:FMN phosphatase YigB (HAD superfamily)
VGILSNITELALAQISSRHPEIFETFDGSSPRLFSCRLGKMKPEPEVYRFIAGYEKVIFIDDRKTYVEVPVRLCGWKGIWFTPWIDETESLRAVHVEDAREGRAGLEHARGGGEKRRPGDARRADSVNELRSHLGDFGVELT